MRKNLKPIFFVALAALTCTAASAESDPEDSIAASDTGFYINAGLNDAWYNPATNGQGFLFSVFPNLDQAFLAWFTFDAELPPEDAASMIGGPGQRWFTAQGPFSGDTANLVLFETRGGIFDQADPVPVTDQAGVGTLVLEFADCSNGMASYDIPSLGMSGEIPIQRIVEDNVPLCEAFNSGSESTGTVD